MRWNLSLLKLRSAILEQAAHGPCKVRRIFKTKTFPYSDNYIHVGQLTTLGTFFLKETFVYPEELPDDSLNPVSLCRSPELSMNTDSKPVMRFTVRQQNQAEIFPVHPFTVLVNIIKFAFLSQEIGFG